MRCIWYTLSMKKVANQKPEKQTISQSKSTSWGVVADWYDSLVEEKKGTYQAELILPNLMRLVDPFKQGPIVNAMPRDIGRRANREQQAVAEAQSLYGIFVDL